MANKFATLLRRRGVILLALSVLSAWVGAKTGGVIHTNGFWEGPI